jgi:hypothetical protein
MEASDTSGEQPQDAGQDQQAGGDPTPEGASPGIAGPAPAQEEAASDSNLTTEQPDQPVQPESERQDAAPDEAEAAQPVESAPSEAPRDQNAEEAQRQSDLEAQRSEHNERTGGGAPVDDGPESGLGQE